MQRQSVRVHGGAGAIRPAGYVRAGAVLNGILQKLMAFLKAHAVMMVAFAAAAVTSIVIPVDASYMGYFDFKTLACLFCVLAVVCAVFP